MAGPIPESIHSYPLGQDLVGFAATNCRSRLLQYEMICSWASQSVKRMIQKKQWGRGRGKRTRKVHECSDDAGTRKEEIRPSRDENTDGEGIEQKVGTAELLKDKALMCSHIHRCNIQC